MSEAVRSGRRDTSSDAVRYGASARAANLARGALALALAGCLATGAPLRADEAPEVPATVDLRATAAPLASALEHLAGLDGREVRVSDDIRDRLSGRLTGRADELIELLADTHDLAVYRDADTIWFDREGRRVVDFVRLDPEQVEPALDALSRPPGVGGAALRDASGKGIVLSGTRRYVESSLQRVLRATGSSDEGGTAPPVAAATATPDDIALAPETAPISTRLSLGEGRTDEVLGARIALVSSRAPRRIVLADGSRLAPGDALPNGHRIVAIERERIVTMRDGGLTIVSMSD